LNSSAKSARGSLGIGCPTPSLGRTCRRGCARWMGRRASGTATIQPVEVNTVAAEKPDRVRAGKRLNRSAASKAATAQPAPERQFLDIDSWSVLLEQLMERPDEEPIERKGGKVK
jgi:hypothetical protein